MIELHCHTNCSDGSLSPESLVKLALSRGIRTLAITDHDTTAAFHPAMEAARGLRLEIVPAIEINCKKGSLDVHVLGYFLDPDHAGLQETLRNQRRARLERARRITETLGRLDVPVRMERVLELSAGGSVGRPHVARALVEAGHVPDINQAFDRYLGTGRPAYVPRHDFTPEDAIRLIREAGGVPVIAHPGLIGDDGVLPGLVEAGARGLEACYPRHSAEERRRYLEMARARGLVATGGSDFHGPAHPYRVELGQVDLPADVVERLREESRR